MQDVPTWRTIASVALPFAATLAMGPAGMALAGSGLPFLSGAGAALASSGGAMGAAGLLKGVLAKAAFQHLVKDGSRRAMDKIEGKSVRDINLGGDPLAMALGRDAQDKLRGDYIAAKKEDAKVDVAGTIMSAVEAQGGLDAFKDAMATEKTIHGIKGLSNMKDVTKATHSDAWTDFAKANPNRAKKVLGKVSGNVLDNVTKSIPKPNLISSGTSSVSPVFVQNDPTKNFQIGPGYGGPVNMPNQQDDEMTWLQQFLEDFKSGKTYSPKQNKKGYF